MASFFSGKSGKASLFEGRQETAHNCGVLVRRAFAPEFQAGLTGAGGYEILQPILIVKEGIVSILSVPIYVRGTVIGAMRVYTAEHWEFTLDDVNFVQALAEIAGIVIDLTPMIEGQNAYIDNLESLKEAREM